MPELPEVEVVRAGLEPAVTGALVREVTVFEPRSLRRHDGPAQDFVARLAGRRLRGAVRRGKFLWLPFSDAAASDASLAAAPSKTQDIGRECVSRALSADPVGESPEFSMDEAVVVHLGMSGQVLLRDPSAADDGLLRVRLLLEHPAHGRIRLDFVDQRIFGSMAIDELVPTPDGRPAGLGSDAALVPSQVAHIARDPLDPAFDDARFIAALRRKSTGVKRAMLDQRLISGIGNIYADEALWAARIHYDQPTSTLGPARSRRLLTEVRLVLGRALAEGGTSFDAQYVNVNGASGYFAHSLNAYGQQGRPCARCGRPIVRETFMNRGSHFCPWCQRAPR